MTVDLSEKGYCSGEKKQLKISGGKGNRMDSQTHMPLRNTDTHYIRLQANHKVIVKKKNKIATAWQDLYRERAE